jgi:hypothetical protein
MDQLPINPFEKLIYDRAFARWQTYGLVLSMFGLVPVLWPFWDQIVETLTFEIAAGLVSLVQIGLVVAIPYRLAAYMAARELADARRGGTIPNWQPPEQPKREKRPVLYLPLQSDLAASWDRDAKRFVVKRDGQPDRIAGPDMHQKLEATRLRIVCADGYTDEQREFLLYRVHLAIALAVEGQEPATTLVKGNSAEDLANKIATDGARTNYRDWRRAQNF